MAVPKKKYPSARKNQRRQHDRLDKPATVQCPQCRQPKLNHRACPECGYYNGREVVAIKLNVPGGNN
jgi:large subunit ribosomal protein L32